jgi:hypothetical protein
MKTWLRVLARIGVALWRQKRTLLAGAGILAALGGYVLTSPAGLTGAPAADRGSVAAALENGDCADRTMAAVVNRTPDTLQQAYQCMDVAFQQRVSEQQFASQLQTASAPNVTKVARVGSYQSPNGAALVYYALDTSSQSVGYIVYLNSQGLVEKVE